MIVPSNVERFFKAQTDIGDDALGERFKSALREDKGRLEYSLEGKKITALFERVSSLNWYFSIANQVP